MHPAEERGIDYPVAVGDGYEICQAFGKHYWPALYFVDADGQFLACNWRLRKALPSVTRYLTLRSWSHKGKRVAATMLNALLPANGGVACGMAHNRAYGEDRR